MRQTSGVAASALFFLVSRDRTGKPVLYQPIIPLFEVVLFCCCDFIVAYTTPMCMS